MDKSNISLIINCQKEDIPNIDIDKFKDKYSKIYFNFNNNLENIVNQLETKYYSIWDFDKDYKNINNLSILSIHKENIDISILIPVYNCEKYIKECLDSCLNQDFTGIYEIIIVDDGSTDNTINLIQQYNDSKIKLYQKEHSGISNTLNFGLIKCNGKYICRMDGDDIMYKYRLSYQYNYMQFHPNCDMLCSGCDCLNSNNKIYDEIGYEINNISINNFLEYHNFILHNTVFIKTSILNQIIKDNLFVYNNRFDGSEDFDLWCRMIDKYNFIINSTKEKVVIYRVPNNQQKYKSRQILDNKIINRYNDKYFCNKTIGIYYIATGEYKKSFKDFLYSLNNFFPKNNRTIILISDGLEEYKTYNKDNINVEYHYINDYQWPIITLFKMKYILDYKGNYDYIFYFNANSIILKSNNYSWFAYNKLNFGYHNSWDLVNHNPSKLLFPLYDNPNSTSYIGTKDYEYIQAAFFGGPSDLVYNMCEEINKMLTIDLQNVIIPKFHDETYLNKYIYQHNTYNTFNIQYIYITQHNKHLKRYETEFIELKYSIGENNNKKEKQYNIIKDQYLQPLYNKKTYEYNEKKLLDLQNTNNKSIIILPEEYKYNDLLFKYNQEVIFTNNIFNIDINYKFYYIITNLDNIEEINQLLNSNINSDVLVNEIYKHNIDEFNNSGYTILYNIFKYKYLYKYHLYCSKNIRLSNNAFQYLKNNINNMLIYESNIKHYYIPTILYDINANIKCLTNNCNNEFKINT